MQEENTNKTEEEKEALAQNNSSAPTDPIQEAYNEASYDLKKYLSGEEFPRTVELITQANKAYGEAESEVNFICLMLALKIIKYDRDTGENVMSMLAAVNLDIHTSSQIWSDIETYIIPAIPELGIAGKEGVYTSENKNNTNTNDTRDNKTHTGETVVSRVVTVDDVDEPHITHFGPDSIEMRLKSVGAPRITLNQLSKGESLLAGVNANIDINNKWPRVPVIKKSINYNSHLDPYRELVDEV